MQKLLLLVLLGCVILSLASAAPRRNRDKKNKDRQGRREQQQPEEPTAEPEPQPADPDSTGEPSVPETVADEEDTDPQCTPWNWGECQPLDGECGRGVKLGVRIGEGCKTTQKEKACTLRCGGGGGKKGSRRKGKQRQEGKQEQDEEQPGESRAETESPVTEASPTTDEAQEAQAVVIQNEIEPCSPWVWTECDPVVEGGDCGKGFKIGTRGGPGCKGNKLKQKPCYVPCPGKGKKPKQAQEQKGRPQTPREDEDNDKDPRCSPWSYAECEPLDGECGKGIKIGTRSGPKCKKTEKEKDCRVPCGNGGGGNGGEGKKKEGRRQKQKDQPRPYDDPEEEEEVEVNGESGKKICKYRRGSWSECDEAKNQQTRTMVLKKGDTEICPEERYITKPCDRIQRKKERKLDCRYGAGDWGLCNTTSGMRMRVDILEDKGMEIEGCRTQRIVYKKCAAACEYEYGEWTSCDSLSQTRTLEGTLLRTEDTPPDCEPTEMKTKPCFGRNGREKCFFGPWSEYSPCLNGYKYRLRELIAGGRKCELQASHAAKCKDKEMKE